MRAKELLLYCIVAAAAYIITMTPNSQFITYDADQYLRMIEGFSAEEPYITRPLIPLLVRGLVLLFHTDPLFTFNQFNAFLVILTCLVLLREHGLIAALVTMLCTVSFVWYLGQPLLDAAIFLWVAIALSFRNNLYVLAILTPLAMAIHPIAFVLCSIVFLFSTRPTFTIPLLCLLGVSYYFFFAPPAGFALFMLPTLDNMLSGAKALNVLWLGIFTLKKDRESAMFVLMFFACFAFTFYMTSWARAFAPLGLILGPKITEYATKEAWQY
jgi:hypothetical protein